MKRINPFIREKPYLLLTSIYPFIIGNSANAFQEARIILKASCLLHEKTTIPGSLAIENPFIRDLLLENEEFIKQGNLMLDLRSTCNSFSDLINEKAINNPYIEIAANHFDNICKSSLSFDAPETSNQFKDDLRKYLLHFINISRKQEVKEQLSSSLLVIENKTGFLTLEGAKKALEGTYLSSRLKNIAIMLYCKAGADVTNSQPLLTENIWASSLIHKTTIPDIHRSHSLRYIADAAVMEYFAIRNEAIDKLSPEEILDIRNEPLTSQYIKELDKSIEESKKIFEQKGYIGNKVAKDTKKLSKIIRDKIHEKCSGEQKRVFRENKVKYAIEEAGGVVVPFISTAKKGITRLSRTMAKKYKISLLDYTTSPLSTYVSRFQKKIIG
jgi:hypothetical protein